MVEVYGLPESKRKYYLLQDLVDVLIETLGEEPHHINNVGSDFFVLLPNGNLAEVQITIERDFENFRRW